MNNFPRSALGLAVAVALSHYSSSASANEDQNKVVEEQEIERIVTTGSRLKKAEFSSPSPIAVMSTEDALETGISSVQEMLSQSVMATGEQIDLGAQLNGPPPGGVGSANISLRGLGAERSLVLVNGRRLAATGVRGAPSQPDINAIPFSIVERVEVSTEAGSSVYGADAVAGTVNVILRNNFEGLELTASAEQPEQTGGENIQFGLLAGSQSEKARVTLAVEASKRNRVSLGDRDYTKNGIQRVMENENGDILFLNRGLSDGWGFVFGYPTNATIPPPAWDGIVRWTEGASDIGISNFSWGTTRADYPKTIIAESDYNDDSERARGDLVGEISKFSVVAMAEVDLTNSDQFYLEAMYLNRSNTAISSGLDIFPQIPANIPLIDELTGLQVTNEFGPVFVDNPMNPFDGVTYLPILIIEDRQQRFDVELQQARVVAGFKGDFESGWLGENNWSYDIYASYDRGTGFVAEPTIFEPHFMQSIHSVAMTTGGDVVCGTYGYNQVGGGYDGAFSPETCIPFDAGNANWYTGGQYGDGTFQSEAYRDFVSAQRNNRTAIEQTVASAYLQGELFEIPGGDYVQVGFGYEYRKDSIESFGDFTGVRGVGLVSSIEGLTHGERDFNEVFAEISLPLVTDASWADALVLDLAARHTEESNFGSDTTYRARMQYVPTDSLSISAGFGTSFRAPNLRESFLAPQVSGLGGAADPCTQRNLQTALEAAGSDSDPVFAHRVANCEADGVVIIDSDDNGIGDTTPLGERGDIGIDVTQGGSTELLPETSETFTFTVSFEQPWTEAVDFSVTASYFDIEIENTVQELNPFYIISECYNNIEYTNLSNPLCRRIQRTTGTEGGANDGIAAIDSSFVNVGMQTSKGVDLTTSLGFDLTQIGNAMLRFDMMTYYSRYLEQEEQIFADVPKDDNVGEIGSPEHRLLNNAVLSWDKFKFILSSRYIGEQKQDPTPLTENFEVLFRSPADGPVRAVGYVDDIWYHNVAMSYSNADYSITFGINNVTDETPPLVDNEVGAPNNNGAVSGTGYDFYGRSAFINARVTF